MNLIDIEDQSVNRKLLPILESYHHKTIDNPRCTRQCWFCKRSCDYGQDICSSHLEHLEWIYTAIDPNDLREKHELTKTDFVDPVGIKIII